MDARRASTYAEAGLAAKLRVTAFGVAAFAAGGTVAAAPNVALLLAVAAAGCVVVALGNASSRIFLVALAALLVGYAFLGRGFAYAGVHPAYVGEVGFVLALLTIVLHGPRRRLLPLEWVVVAFIVWGSARTLPFAAEYGLAAPRDGIVWGYATFALALSFVLREADLTRAFALSRRLVLPYAVWVPFAAVAGIGFASAVPVWPGSGEPMLVFKGDYGVYLAGAAALLALDTRRGRSTLARAATWTAILVAAATIGAINRGGFLAFAGAIVVLLVAGSTRTRVQMLAVAGSLAIAAIAVNPSITLGPGRDVSPREFVVHTTSIFSETDDKELEGTESFRFAWWREIVSYTLLGDYFWGGKGYGVNLADADGFQVSEDHSLRAPHNTHLTILARSGVPGFAIWMLLQLAFATALVRALRRARRAGEATWAAIYATLLALWVAITIHTSFDPYLEAPQGGIWYGSIVGIGLAAMRLRSPEATRPSTPTTFAGPPSGSVRATHPVSTKPRSPAVVGGQRAS